MERIDDALRHPSALVAPWVLLLLAERPSHGYEIIEGMKASGFPDSVSGRVYRQLRRLEDAQLVHSYWESSQVHGPSRRIHELTPAGTEALRRCQPAAVDLASTLVSYRRRLRALPPTPADADPGV